MPVGGAAGAAGGRRAARALSGLGERLAAAAGDLVAALAGLPFFSGLALAGDLAFSALLVGDAARAAAALAGLPAFSFSGLAFSGLAAAFSGDLGGMAGSKLRGPRAEERGGALAGLTLSEEPWKVALNGLQHGWGAK